MFPALSWTGEEWAVRSILFCMYSRSRCRRHVRSPHARGVRRKQRCAGAKARARDVSSAQGTRSGPLLRPAALRENANEKGGSRMN